MIVKILSSASNFAGIHYNERKNDTGKSELLCVENFGSLALNSHPSKADYVNYLKSFCNRNTRVKKVQFHAVISAKGKEYSLDKLSNIGVQFLQAMGYGNNPYLIYHHGDTDHRHIHLISTRVDRFGKKVDDRFEKLRSQQVMHNILLRDPHCEADLCLTSALNYHFSTIAQFKLLLELQGFRVVKTPDGLAMSKYGCILKPLDTGAIEDRIRSYALPGKRAAQLKAIFSKCALGTIDEQWCSFMKEKFGVDVIFHQKKGHDKPYGYSVIDHPSHIVFKGAQILRLAELLTLPKEKQVNELTHELAQQPGLSFSDFSVALSRLGIHINPNASYSSKVGRGKLSIEVINNLRYAERLKTASTIFINDPSCQTVLGSLLRINPADLNSSILSRKHPIALGATVQYLDQSRQWEEGLKHYNFKLLRNERHTFLFAPTEPALLRLDKLLGQPPAHLHVDIPLIHEIKEMEIKHEFSASNLLEAMISILAESQRGPHEDKKNKRSSIKL